MPRISEGFMQKFTIAILTVAFATIVWQSQVNKRYFYGIVYGERSVGAAKASLALVTRLSKKPHAEDAVTENCKLVADWGWNVASVEVSQAEEYQEAFGGAFSNRPTKSPYLSFVDSKRRPMRVYFFDAPPLTLEDFRERLKKSGMKKVKLVDSWKEK